MRAHSDIHLGIGVSPMFRKDVTPGIEVRSGVNHVDLAELTHTS